MDIRVAERRVKPGDALVDAHASAGTQPRKMDYFFITTREAIMEGL